MKTIATTILTALLCLILTQNSYSKVHFSLNLGIFKKELAKDKLMGYSYRMIKKLSGGYEYHVGEFENYVSVKKARKDFIDNGFEKVKIQSFNNNIEVKLEEALDLIGGVSEEDVFKYSETISVAELNYLMDKRNAAIATANGIGEREPDSDPKKEVKSAIYKVQIGLFSSPKNFELIEGYNVNEYKSDKGMYGYTLGEFDSKDGATDLLMKVKESGYQDAFIATFSEGKRVY